MEFEDRRVSEDHCGYSLFLTCLLYRTSIDDAELQKLFTTDFTSLVSDRILPVETIIKIIVMAVGALWRVRLIRDSSSKEPRLSSSKSAVVENKIASHVLSIFTSLLRIGVLQVTDGHDLQRTPGGSTNLALGITAVFRRTLPALRISSKWIRAHLSYLVALAPARNSTSPLKTLFVDFWAAYQSFFTTLLNTFPLSEIPVLSNPLEEDVDMSGFVPLKKTMTAASTKSLSGLEPGQSQVHPNEEHLMRIWDLLQDSMEVAKEDVSYLSFSCGIFTHMHVLTDLQKSPIVFQETPARFSFKGLEGPASPKHKHPRIHADALMVPPSVMSHRLLQQAGAHSRSASDVKDEIDDDGATVSTRTDDDPVNLAMQATLDLDISDDGMMEDDEIVYPKQSVKTPIKYVHDLIIHLILSNSAL